LDRGGSGPSHALPARAAGTSDPMSALLEVAGLAKHFPVRRGAFGLVSGHVRAVDGVDFELRAGEPRVIGGDSGCGKATVGRLVLRLIEPSAGQVRFEGEDLLALSDNEMRARRQRMQVIFQDPYASLNPRMTVGAMLGEPLMLHGLAKSEAARKARARPAPAGWGSWLVRARSPPAAIRTNSPAASASGSRSPARSRSNPS